MTRQASLSEIFASFEEYMKTESDKREEIRNQVKILEQTARQLITSLQGIHQADGIKHTSDICKTVRGSLETVKSQYKDLGVKIPDGQYYRFHDHWRLVTQRLVFVTALVVYLESERLVTREETAEMLGIHVDKAEGFHIDLDDFLMGLLLVASELSRMCINAVTAGDYTRPLRIGQFVGELDSGFRLLNLKNDALRKRFDALKYDLKKIEEVIYDITIRGLVPGDRQAASPISGSGDSPRAVGATETSLED
ncbi:translin-like [Lineus longissimus]|uniref:translin-like n=1 Tax=Lineus longissimus TaxID=88925 RepID=UPI002B4FB561